MIQIVIGNKSFYADGYINSKDNSIQFYQKRSDLDYMPPIKIKDDVLSDFGKEVLGQKVRRKNDKRIYR